MIICACGKCKLLDVLDSPSDRKCIRCGSDFVSLNISSVKWNELGDGEKEEITDKCIREHNMELGYNDGFSGVNAPSFTSPSAFDRSEVPTETVDVHAENDIIFYDDTSQNTQENSVQAGSRTEMEGNGASSVRDINEPEEMQNSDLPVFRDKSVHIDKTVHNVEYKRADPDGKRVYPGQAAAGRKKVVAMDRSAVVSGPKDKADTKVVDLSKKGPSKGLIIGLVCGILLFIIAGVAAVVLYMKAKDSNVDDVYEEPVYEDEYVEDYYEDDYSDDSSIDDNENYDDEYSQDNEDEYYDDSADDGDIHVTAESEDADELDVEDEEDDEIYVDVEAEDADDGTIDVEEEVEPEEPEVIEEEFEEEESESYTLESVDAVAHAVTSAAIMDLPSDLGNQIGSLSEGQEVSITGRCMETGWYRIIFRDGVAYIPSECVDY